MQEIVGFQLTANRDRTFAPPETTTADTCHPVSPPPPVGVAEYCDERVCPFVCLSVLSVREPTYGLHVRSSPIFLRMQPMEWFGPPLMALRYDMYFGFYG